MIIGYVRVSTDQQSTDRQRQELQAAGCEAIYSDEGVSGVARARPGLVKAIAALKPGDVFIVAALDRLGRSTGDLIRQLEAIHAAGADFRSLTEAMDTRTALGVLLFQISGAFAQFERSLIVDRTRSGLAAAKKRGVRNGRRRLLNAQQVTHAQSLIDSGERTKDVAASLGVSYWTLHRALIEKDGKAAAA